MPDTTPRASLVWAALGMNMHHADKPHPKTMRVRAAEELICRRAPLAATVGPTPLRPPASLDLRVAR